VPGAASGELGHLLAAREIAEGSIVPIPLQGTRLGGIRMGLLVPRRRKLSAAADAMVEMLSDEFASLDIGPKNKVGES
jgi:DNA-binding transcriptional LysR family regulator